MEIKTDIIIFLPEDGRKKTLKDCTIIKEFMYKRENFIIVSSSKYYRVCYINDDKTLYSFWCREMYDGNTKLTYNEILSTFRKEYDKNNINGDLIRKFIKEPKKTISLNKKKTKVKKT